MALTSFLWLSHLLFNITYMAIASQIQPALEISASNASMPFHSYTLALATSQASASCTPYMKMHFLGPHTKLESPRSSSLELCSPDVIQDAVVQILLTPTQGAQLCQVSCLVSLVQHPCQHMPLGIQYTMVAETGHPTPPMIFQSCPKNWLVTQSPCISK